jgi:hypothetical protein
MGGRGLQSLAQAYRDPATGADGRRQQTITWRLLGIIGERDIAVLSFLGTEFCQRVAKWGFGAGETVDLRSIVLVNGFLDRDGASHCSALAESGGRCAKGEAGEMPERQQRGRPDAAIGNYRVERVEMHLLLILHVAELVCTGTSAQYGKLASVNPSGAIFAGMVDADHAMDGGIGW